MLPIIIIIFIIIIIIIIIIKCNQNDSVKTKLFNYKLKCLVFSTASRIWSTVDRERIFLQVEEKLVRNIVVLFLYLQNSAKYIGT